MFLELPQQSQTVESISGHPYIRTRISLTFFVKKLILWSEGLSLILLSASSKVVWELYIIFNEIVKATHVRSRAAYRLKIITGARSINDQFLALIRMLIVIL